MTCVKCGYEDSKNEVKKYGECLCSVCNTFAPSEHHKFLKYINEKIDWKKIDTFRTHGEHRGIKQKKGMKDKAEKGEIMSRAAFGYSIREGRLVPNEDSAKVHALFKEFLKKDDTLTTVSKKYGLSVNGLKKILKNRTYLGEIKFDSQLHKADHTAIVSSEIFYEVQRKLKKKLRPRKGLTKNKHVLKGETNPLKEKDISIDSEETFMRSIQDEPSELYSEVFE